jgi:predicted alpha/beta-fold hydrolase
MSSLSDFWSKILDCFSLEKSLLISHKMISVAETSALVSVLPDKIISFISFVKENTINFIAALPHNEKAIVYSCLVIFISGVMYNSISSAIITYHKHQDIRKLTMSKSSIRITMAFDEMLKKYCPSLSSYRPTPWLFNTHLQTIMASEFQNSYGVQYEKQVWVNPECNGSFGIHFFPTSSIDILADTPVVVLFHGLTGDSGEPYCTSIAAQSKYNDDQKIKYRYRTVVIHGRGCGDAPVTTAQLHTPHFTGDARFAIEKLRKMYPFANFVLVGFSLGANVMINYIGEEGNQLNDFEYGKIARVVGAISISNPFDIYICSHSLESTFLRKSTYAWKIALKLKNYFKKYNISLHLSNLYI